MKMVMIIVTLMMIMIVMTMTMLVLSAETGAADVELVVKELNTTIDQQFCTTSNGCNGNNQSYFIRMAPLFGYEPITLQFRSVAYSSVDLSGAVNVKKAIGKGYGSESLKQNMETCRCAVFTSNIYKFSRCKHFKLEMFIT